MTHRSNRRSAPRPTAVIRAVDRVLGTLPGTNPLRRANLAWVRISGRLGRHSRLFGGEARSGFQVAVPTDGWADALAPHLSLLRRRLSEALGVPVGPLELVVRAGDFPTAPAAPLPEGRNRDLEGSRDADPQDLARVESWGVKSPALARSIARAMGAARAQADDESNESLDPVP